MVLLGRLRGGPTLKPIAFFSIKDRYNFGLKSPFKATFLGEEDLKRRSRGSGYWWENIGGGGCRKIFAASEVKTPLATLAG